MERGLSSVEESQSLLGNGATFSSPETTSSRKENGLPAVLLVSQNEINMKLLQRFMKKFKCTYTGVSNVTDALEAFKSATGPDRRKFRVVLTDFTVPLQDVLSLARGIREFEHAQRANTTPKGYDSEGQQEESQRPSVIAAHFSLCPREIRDEALGAGIDSILQHPLRFVDVRSVLQDAGIECTLVPRTHH
ncbi:hypothetical protein VTO42DRAFT_8126 [Malbranchea cinnamomea]